MADCRRCVFFLPVRLMGYATRDYALRWIEENRPGAELLGWCTRYNRPVTYYRGKCSGYTPKIIQEKPPKPLTYYLENAVKAGKHE